MAKENEYPGKRGRKGASRPVRGARGRLETGFTCTHCGAYVSTASVLSGVQNRNHCPNCLWSRHVDSARAGDRQAACKGSMKPVGLTAKKVKKKYGPEHGELMLIHQCQECGKISINRIAADDSPAEVVRIFEGSFEMEPALRERIEQEGIEVFGEERSDEVQTQLFGRGYQGE